jgi:hypothetical protein
MRLRTLAPGAPALPARKRLLAVRLRAAPTEMALMPSARSRHSPRRQPGCRPCPSRDGGGTRAPQVARAPRNWDPVSLTNSAAARIAARRANRRHVTLRRRAVATRMMPSDKIGPAARARVIASAVIDRCRTGQESRESTAPRAASGPTQVGRAARQPHSEMRCSTRPGEARPTASRLSTAAGTQARTRLLAAGRALGTASAWP